MRSPCQFQPVSPSNVRFLLFFQLGRKHKRKSLSSRSVAARITQHRPRLWLSCFLQYLNGGYDKVCTRRLSCCIFFFACRFLSFVECQYFGSFSSAFIGVWIPNLKIFRDLNPFSTSQDCLLTWFFVCVWTMLFEDRWETLCSNSSFVCVELYIYVQSKYFQIVSSLLSSLFSNLVCCYVK